MQFKIHFDLFVNLSRHSANHFAFTTKFASLIFAFRFLITTLNCLAFWFENTLRLQAIDRSIVCKQPLHEQADHIIISFYDFHCILVWLNRIEFIQQSFSICKHVLISEQRCFFTNQQIILNFCPFLFMIRFICDGKSCRRRHGGGACR